MDIMWPSAARRASTAISIGSSYGSIYSTSSTNSASDPDASAVSSILDEALLEEGRALMSQAAAKLVDSGEPDLEEILELFNSALTKCPSLLPDMVSALCFIGFGIGFRKGWREGGRVGRDHHMP